MRGAALLALKRKGEALKAFGEADRLNPREPLVSKLQLLAGLVAKDPDVGTQALDRMIARFPDEVRALEPRGVMWLMGNLADKDRNEDRLIALVRLGYGGEADGDYLARQGIEILLARKDVAGATELLAHIDEPVVIEDMLILRRFAPLWPALETRAGAGLEKARASVVRVAEMEHAENPDDNQTLASLVNALRHAGRHSEAIALQSKLPATVEEMAAADQDMGWAVNYVALALDEVGRSDEADRLFARLNDAPMSEDHARWRVSMIINRLELLVLNGEFERAAQLIDLTKAWARDRGSPYARQLVRRLHYCTLSGLGRSDEAAKLEPELLAHARDARHATVEGFLCSGNMDRAEALVLQSLDNLGFQTDFVRSLQARPLTSDDPSKWQGRWHELRRRPAIAAAFERFGRDMPAALVPPRVLPAGVTPAGARAPGGGGGGNWR